MSVRVMCGRVLAYPLMNPKFKAAFLATSTVLAAAAAVPAEARTYATQPQGELFGFPFQPGLEAEPQPQQVSPLYRGYRTRAVRSAAAVRSYRSYNREESFAAPVASGSSSVLNEASRWVGHGNVTGSHRAWCADFANFVLKRTGHRASGSGMVDSMLSVGSRVSRPNPGDLVVMRSHVTIFAGYGGKGFYGLGGNQHHRVAMSNYPLHSVVAFVHPN